MDLTDNPVELRKLDKEVIIQRLLEGKTYTVDTIPLRKDKFGNNVEREWEDHDCYSGNLVGRHRVAWTYHDAEKGIVADIDVQVGNRVQRISHSAEAKAQPTVTKYIVMEPIPIGEKIVEGAAGGVTGAASGIGSFVKKILGRGE